MVQNGLRVRTRNEQEDGWLEADGITGTISKLTSGVRKFFGTVLREAIREISLITKGLTLYTAVIEAAPSNRGKMVVRKIRAEKKNHRAPSIAEARVYRALKKAILSGQHPPGCVLIQENLCREFRISRTPVGLTHLQANVSWSRSLTTACWSGNPRLDCCPESVF
jgi:hypothetical protein